MDNPCFSINALHTCYINCGPQSDTISSGIPKYLNMCCNRSSAVLNVVGKAGGENGPEEQFITNKKAILP